MWPMTRDLWVSTFDLHSGFSFGLQACYKAFLNPKHSDVLSSKSLKLDHLNLESWTKLCSPNALRIGTRWEARGSIHNYLLHLLTAIARYNLERGRPPESYELPRPVGLIAIRMAKWESENGLFLESGSRKVLEGALWFGLHGVSTVESSSKEAQRDRSIYWPTRVPECSKKIVRCLPASQMTAVRELHNALSPIHLPFTLINSFWFFLVVSFLVVSFMTLPFSLSYSDHFLALSFKRPVSFKDLHSGQCSTFEIHWLRVSFELLSGLRTPLKTWSSIERIVAYQIAKFGFLSLNSQFWIIKFFLSSIFSDCGDCEPNWTGIWTPTILKATREKFQRWAEFWC